LRSQIVKFVHRATAQRLMISTYGTVSARWRGDDFLITPTGIDRRELQQGDVVQIRGGSREPGKLPSRSVKLHQSIYRRHPHVQSIILTQSPNAMAFAVSGRRFDTRTIPESYLLLKDVPLVPYGEQFAGGEGVVRRLSPSTPILLLQNDCVLVSGALGPGRLRSPGSGRVQRPLDHRQRCARRVGADGRSGDRGSEGKLSQPLTNGTRPNGVQSSSSARSRPRSGSAAAILVRHARQVSTQVESSGASIGSSISTPARASAPPPRRDSDAARSHAAGRRPSAVGRQQGDRHALEPSAGQMPDLGAKERIRVRLVALDGASTSASAPPGADREVRAACDSST
jgi:Class II Aldolase and Adducin N-terminal domain